MNHRGLSAICGITIAVGAGVGFGAGAATAHPLGNLTVNTSARIVVGPEATTIDYILDLAELPTVQERPAISAAGTEAAYAATKCAALSSGLALTVGSVAVPLGVTSATMVLLPGQGGLSTVRVECRLTGEGVAGTAAVAWTDTNFSDRVGWREVIAVGDGSTLTSTLPTVSTSDFLRAYPTGMPSPRVLEAAFDVGEGGPRLVAPEADPSVGDPAASQSRGADGLTAFFNRLVGDRDLTVGLGLLAAGVAFLLGALHSMAPGHGKTLMAAMIASRRGTVRQVLMVGGTVAVTHTFGVVVLGIIITTSQAVAPDQILPWLTVASGAMLLATGAWLLGRRMLLGPSAGGHHHGTFGHGHGHGHEHGHEHEHEHGHDADGGHVHDHESHGRHAGEQPLRTRSLALLGMAGGLVPTPSALVVLLGATALGRAWFGVVLVGVYGIGMAATLLIAGIVLVKLQGWLERQYAEARWLSVGMRLLPVATAMLLILGGLSLAVRGAAAI